jgi:hypothetical protein
VLLVFLSSSCRLAMRMNAANFDGGDTTPRAAEIN